MSKSALPWQDFAGLVSAPLVVGQVEKYLYSATALSAVRYGLASPGHPEAPEVRQVISYALMGPNGCAPGAAATVHFSGHNSPEFVAPAAVAEAPTGASRLLLSVATSDSNWAGSPLQVVSSVSGAGDWVFGQQVDDDGCVAGPRATSMTGLYLPASGRFLAYYLGLGLTSLDMTTTTGDLGNVDDLASCSFNTDFSQALEVQRPLAQAAGVVSNAVAWPGSADQGVFSVSGDYYAGYNVIALRIDGQTGQVTDPGFSVPTSGSISTLYAASIEARVFLFSIEQAASGPAAIRAYELTTSGMRDLHRQLGFTGGVSGAFVVVAGSAGMNRPVLFASHPSTTGGFAIDVYDTGWVLGEATPSAPALTIPHALTQPGSGYTIHAVEFGVVARFIPPVVHAYLYQAVYQDAGDQFGIMTRDIDVTGISRSQ